jgi:hypothetical protein
MFCTIWLLYIIFLDSSRCSGVWRQWLIDDFYFRTTWTIVSRCDWLGWDHDIVVAFILKARLSIWVTARWVWQTNRDSISSDTVVSIRSLSIPFTVIQLLEICFGLLCYRRFAPLLERSILSVWIGWYRRAGGDMVPLCANKTHILWVSFVPIPPIWNLFFDDLESVSRANLHTVYYWTLSCDKRVIEVWRIL